MSTLRTTTALVETAIAGALRAGLPIAAVDVHGGGFVRILISTPKNSEKLVEAITCDELFKGPSN